MSVIKKNIVIKTMKWTGVRLTIVGKKSDPVIKWQSIGTDCKLVDLENGWGGLRLKVTKRERVLKTRSSLGF